MISLSGLISRERYESSIISWATTRLGEEGPKGAYIFRKAHFRKSSKESPEGSYKDSSSIASFDSIQLHRLFTEQACYCMSFCGPRQKLNECFQLDAEFSPQNPSTRVIKTFVEIFHCYKVRLAICVILSEPSTYIFISYTKLNNTLKIPHSRSVQLNRCISVRYRRFNSGFVSNFSYRIDVKNCIGKCGKIKDRTKSNERAFPLFYFYNNFG